MERGHICTQGGSNRGRVPTNCCTESSSLYPPRFCVLGSLAVVLRVLEGWNRNLRGHVSGVD